MSGNGLPIWTIFERPVDFPQSTVARLFINDQPTDKIMFGNIETMRQYFRELGLVCITRKPGDHPSVVECWI